AKLKEKLLARECPETVVENVVIRLTMEGWINDRRFAEHFAESALATQRFFGPRLKLEMRRRGVSADLIDEVLGRIRGEHDEVEGARSLLVKRFPGFSFSVAADREKRRVIAFLQRRGYGFSAIMKAMRELV
ncbi:MAG: regulatory protein RecX, partial [Pseudomonadota bacterium]